MKIEDFKTNYEPSDYDKEWIIRMLNSVGDGNYWGSSAGKFKVDLSNKILSLNEWVHGYEEDIARTIKITKLLGWTVTMQVDETKCDFGMIFTEDPETNLRKLEDFRKLT
jgi:hypothetical protein